jgi:hypothetical protein
LPYSSYTITFTATTAACYVGVTNAQGQSPLSVVLQKGQSQQLTLTGNGQVDLGAPKYIQVSIDGTPVTFPSPTPTPLNLILDAGSATAPTSSTTTTSTPSTTTPTSSTTTTSTP